MQIKDLNKEQLWQLRKEITLNSLFLKDYANSFGIARSECFTFFKGYVEYLCELQNTDYGFDLDIFDVIDMYDNEQNLYNWFCCIEWEVE